MADTPDSSTTRKSEELSFKELVAFIRRHVLGIAGASVLGAVVAGIVVSSLPRTWEASATLVIVPPKFSSDLKPPTLTVQGYQKVLESDAVVAETKRRLVEARQMDASQPLRVGTELSSRIFVSRRSEATSLAPMVEVVAQGGSADLAAAIANTWSQVFLDRTRELMAGSTSSTVKFIEAQYPEVREQLLAAENERLITADSLRAEQDRATTRWDRTVTDYENATIRLTSEYQAQTQELVGAYRAAHSISLRKDQLQSLRTTYSQLQTEQAQVKALLEQKRLQLEAARNQLAKTPQFLSLRKAITDEALWEEVSKEKTEPDWNALRERSLVKQELNPAFAELTSRTSQLAIETDALVPRSAELESQLKDMADRVKDLDSALRNDEAKLESLQAERQAGLTTLKNNRDYEAAVLRRSRNAELLRLQDRQHTRLSQMDRDIQEKTSLFEQLANNFNQASLAKAQVNLEDVRLAAAAVPPDRPLTRRAGVISILGLLFGGMVAVVLALVREALSS